MRKAKGLSQDELARLVKISRPSVAQIELGNRGVDIVELQRFSQILGFSLDDFVSTDFSPGLDERVQPAALKQKDEIRVSVPALQIPKFKNVLLYILERCAG